jgi:hypothetical protein
VRFYRADFSRLISPKRTTNAHDLQFRMNYRVNSGVENRIHFRRTGFTKKGALSLSIASDPVPVHLLKTGNSEPLKVTLT